MYNFIKDFCFINIFLDILKQLNEPKWRNDAVLFILFNIFYSELNWKLLKWIFIKFYVTYKVLFCYKEKTWEGTLRVQTTEIHNFIIFPGDHIRTNQICLVMDVHVALSTQNYIAKDHETESTEKEFQTYLHISL